MLSKNEMKALVDEIVALSNELRRYHEFEDTPARPRAPASKETLASFEQKYRGKLPPSYLRLLSIYDGIENLDWVDVSILSIEYLLKHENLDETWIDSGAYGEGELFVFAQSNSDAHAVAFLLKTANPQGEMKVAHFDAGGIFEEYDNLDAYLRGRRTWYEESIAQEKADRGSLVDD